MRVVVRVILISLFAGFLAFCEKDFDVNNPEVEVFVKQLKNGTCNNYEANKYGDWGNVDPFGETTLRWF